MTVPISNTSSLTGIQGGIYNLLTRRPFVLQFARFMAIGVLNTTLDFIIFNFLTKQFSIQGGYLIVLANAVGFSAAVIQSFFWNKAWIFSWEAQISSLTKTIFRLIGVGIVGVSAFALVLVGASQELNGIYYIIILAGFILLELILWYLFGLHIKQDERVGVSPAGVQFFAFLVVSLIGYAINSGIIYAGIQLLPRMQEMGVHLNPDLIKNVAKMLATIVSLIWNFIGYKLFVFKK